MRLLLNVRMCQKTCRYVKLSETSVLCQSIISCSSWLAVASHIMLSVMLSFHFIFMFAKLQQDKSLRISVKLGTPLRGESMR